MYTRTNTTTCYGLDKLEKKIKEKTTAKTVQQFDATGWLQVTLTKSLSEL